MNLKTSSHGKRGIRFYHSRHTRSIFILNKFIQTYRVLFSWIVACLILSTFQASAQSGSDNVTINITFRPVQTISVSPAQKSIDISYASIDDHQNGISVTRDDHLTVFSTGGFLVSVEASSENFTRMGGTETIPVKDVIIRAVDGTDNTAGAEFSDVVLSTAPSALITSSSGGRDLKYGITYDNSSGREANQYINRYMSRDGAETVYRSRITYTITTR